MVNKDKVSAFGTDLFILCFSLADKRGITDIKAFFIKPF